MISISGHKIYGPKGVGALIVRRRKFNRLPLKPLFFGGEQRGLRPGTLPVPLVVGLGIASELALKHHKQRAEICRQYRNKVLDGLAPLNPIINGDVDRTIPHVVNTFDFLTSTPKL